MSMVCSYWPLHITALVSNCWQDNGGGYTNKHRVNQSIMNSARSGARPPLPSLNEYILTERLGSGTYASVYKAYKKSGCRETVAVKCVRRSSLNSISKENLMTEIELLKTLRHEHIVELKDFEWDTHYIYLIMEYCSGGDLMSFLMLRRALHEDLVRNFLQQIASALKYMREKLVAHLDLKPQNILLTSKTSPVLKIADFGFAHYILDDVDTPYLKGSPLYMAPEIVCQRHYDAKADLWSVGVILYECLFGQTPFASSSVEELAEKIRDERPIQIPQGFDVSPNCRDLVLRLLTRDPAQRITFEEFFDHAFLELDRMPSRDSYPRAVELVKTAIEKDRQQDYVTAVGYYVKAMDLFLGAIQYETNEEKKEQLRSKVKEYLARTEHLKAVIKSKVTDSCSKGHLGEELVLLSEAHPQLPTVFGFQKKAFELEKEGKFQEALEKHQKTIQQLLKIAQEVPESRLRDLLYQHIQESLAHAEKLSDYTVTLKTEAAKRRPTTSFTNSLKDSCSVQ